MGTRVLIVDDHNLMLIVQKKFWKENYNIIPDIAKSAEEALRLLPGKQYDIIIVDLNMPGMKGNEFTSEIRKRGDKTPIIILSGEDTREAVQNCIVSGANDYILKPPDKQSYFQKIGKLIEIKPE